MEIFKLFEATMANMQPGRVNFKDLRRDQLLDHYDEAVKTLETLIKAKENEIAYRRNLIEMLELSKPLYDNKLTQVKQEYQFVRKQVPSTVDLKAPTKKSSEPLSQVPEAVTPPLPNTSPTIPTPSSQSSIKAPSELDVSFHIENQNENRSSLDRRLSEFLKTFPNLTQAGLATTAPNDTAKPQPGYYTQQPIPPPPPQIAATPPFMAMMRFPPPPMLPQNQNLNASNHENHETADMDLSDHDEPNKGSDMPTGVSNIPIVTSSMPPGVVGQHFNNPGSVPYAPRLNPLAFDPSIMDSGFRDSPSSSHDKHSERSSGGSQRHSGGSSSGEGAKHGSSSSSSRGSHKYQSTSSSSSHSSSRSRRR